jgi:hypothetical protein
MPSGFQLCHVNRNANERLDSSKVETTPQKAGRVCPLKAGGSQWLMSVILTTQEAESGGLWVKACLEK